MLGSIGPYRIVRLLGQGASGKVYAAVDDAVDRALAIKCIELPSAADDTVRREARARFLAEAHATRALRHPDIAAVVDAGEAAGQAWIAMELAPGVDLQRYARPARRLPSPVVLRIGARLAGALAHAHGAGLLHRDVKPSNVLVHWPSDTLKLTDFGLARTVDAEATRTGLVIGSPAYLAPEQLAGASAGPRTDLYALGVLIFELLTGRRPFDADSLGALLQQVSRAPLPDPRQWAPDLPDDALALLQALLAKSAADRPASAAEVADRLARWASPRDPVARGGGPKSHPG